MEILNIGPLEFVVIAIVAVLLVGPDRLPKMMAEGIKWLRILRDQAAKARSEIAAVADLDPALTEDLRRSVADIAELHPRRIVSSLIDDATGSTSAATANQPPVMRSIPNPSAAPAVAPASATPATAAAPLPTAPSATAPASATPAPVNSFGASATSTSMAPRPADAPATRVATPPAAYDSDAT
jgi:Sec-independent protein translocase protein TatA